MFMQFFVKREINFNVNNTKYYRNTLTTVPDVSIQTKWFWFFYSEKALIVNLSNIF